MLCLLKNNPQQHPKVGPYLLSHPRFGQWKGTFFFEVSPLYSDISSSHFIWHSDILYLEFYLTYNYINLSLPFYLHLSAIYSDILSGDLVVILSDIFFVAIRSGILFIWHSIWHSIWNSIWHIFWHPIWHFIGHSCRHSIWHPTWHRFWLPVWHFIWRSIWHVWDSSVVFRSQPSWSCNLSGEEVLQDLADGARYPCYPPCYPPWYCGWL